MASISLTTHVSRFLLTLPLLFSPRSVFATPATPTTPTIPHQPQQQIPLLPASSAIPHHDVPRPNSINDSSPMPYCLVGAPCFPSDSSWALGRFNASLSGALRRTEPVASVCYAGPSYNAEACAALPNELVDPDFRRLSPATVQYPNWEILANGTGCPLPPAPSPSLSFDAFASSAPPNASACHQGAVAPLVVDLALIGPTNRTWWGRPGRSREENVARAVQSVVKFSKDRHARLRIKNTGHDYLGRSSGEGALTLLTASLNHTRFNSTFVPSCPSSSPSSPSSSSYRPVPPPVPALEIGAGVINAALYAAADRHGVGVAGGASRTVGAGGGFVSGGGHGPLGRTWGMGSDNALQFEIVTADGQVRNASVCENPDLFWALRGGGAGTFGVVLRVWFRAHPELGGVAGLFGTVTVKNATLWSDVVQGLLNLMPDLDERGIAGYAETMYPTVHLAFVHPFVNGTATDVPLKDGFAPLRKLADGSGGQVNVTLAMVVETSWYRFWKGPLQEAFGALDATGVNLLLGSRLVPRAVVEDDKKRSKLSGVIAGLQSPAIIHLVAGGAIAAIEARSSALNPAWRSALLHIDMPATWPSLQPSPASSSSYAASLSKIQSYVHSVTGQLDAVSAFGDGVGAAYMNEADVEEGEWREVFWGKEHYAVLQRVKGKWDPEGVFSCRKCVGSEVHGF